MLLVGRDLERDPSKQVLMPMSGSRNKEICPICCKKEGWEARPTHLTDAPPQQTGSVCTHRESAMVSSPPLYKLQGLVLGL